MTQPPPVDPDAALDGSGETSGDQEPVGGGDPSIPLATTQPPPPATAINTGVVDVGCNVRDADAQFRFCGAEHSVCACRGAVWYGIRNSWSVLESTGLINCTNAVFGIPSLVSSNIACARP